ncbi:MAG TPA: PQQ-dependent sugar dehydrogenase [Gammaproteobacteria bacterium]|nr:PQQ-dependent sugar dehydrogenase [Gammaproteobacteria bacterium]
MKLVCKVAAFAALGVVAWQAGAQQAPARGGTPRAPTGIVVPPLGAGPFMYKTAEGQDIRVVVLARGLDHPWSIAFLPNGDKLVTERAGRLRVMHGDKLDPTPVQGVPAVQARGLSGLFDIALHPQFATNHFVYLTYAKPPPEGGMAGNGLARGVWDGKALTNVREIFLTTDTSTVSRITFGRDGMLYMSTWGDRADIAQKTDGLGGKVLRLRDDGTVPPDNPFVGKAGYRPEIYTLGHRSTLGLQMHPGTGQIWENENGPNGGDEINVLVPGGNYGWPLVSLGRTYAGPWQSPKGFSLEGMIDPIVYWTPAIAVSGMAFYTGNKLPKWKGDVFVGGMRRGEVPGTGHLERILFNEKMEELRRETLLADLQQRIRDVRQGPDELLYVLTDETDGALFRIEPAN